LPAGCGKEDSKSDLRPEGPPDILQVFVRDGAGVSRLAYGEHPDITGTPDDPPDLVPPLADLAGPVEDAVLLGNRIRIVFDELIRGSTVEQFVCACDPLNGGCSTLGHTFSGTEVNPEQCSSCADNPATPDPENETGKCADADFDGVPDDAVLQPGIVTITCGVGSVTTSELDGWYTPSGNQQVPTSLGINALGPALVISPPVLPADQDCEVSVATSVTDKDGNAVPAAAATFHTEPLVVLTESTSPPNGATNVPFDVVSVSIPLNSTVDLASLTSTTVTVVVAGETTPVAGALDLEDPTTILWTAAAPLTPSTEYEVSVTTGVTDSFGVNLSAGHTFTFTTAAP
jgi:hypothetical protein